MVSLFCYFLINNSVDKLSYLNNSRFSSVTITQIEFQDHPSQFYIMIGHNTNRNYQQLYVASLTSHGIYFWERWIGNSSYPFIITSRAMSLDSSDNTIYVTGSFQGTSVQFTPEYTFSSKSVSVDIFVVKLDYFGTVQWITTAGGNYEDVANAIFSDTIRTIITGSFQDKTTFSSKVLLGFLRPFQKQVFVAQLNTTTGIFDWAISLISVQDSVAKRITVIDNVMYFSGIFSTALLTTYKYLTSRGSMNIFLMRSDISDSASRNPIVSNVNFANEIIC